MSRAREINQAIEVLGQERVNVRPEWRRLLAGIDDARGLLESIETGAREENFWHVWNDLDDLIDGTVEMQYALLGRERILGREGNPNEARCECALDAIRAYQALENIVNAATVGGLGVETFDKFPGWLRKNKEDLRRPLQDFQESCGVDIGPGSPLTPILFQLDKLDTFAETRGQFETQLRATQMLQNLFTALEKC